MNRIRPRSAAAYQAHRPLDPEDELRAALRSPLVWGESALLLVVIWLGVAALLLLGR